MKHSFRLPLRCIVYLLLLTMLATGVSFSRYKTTLSGSASVSIARPVVTFTGGSVDLSSLRPGVTRDYPFDVKNFDEQGRRTEVTMRYCLSAVQMNSDLPITLKIYSGEREYTGDWVTLGFNEDITQAYTLRVSWPEENRGAEYMSKTGSIKITLDAVQVD